MARTNELETYWSHYRCEDENCPGRRRNAQNRMSHAEKMREWTQLTYEDGIGSGRKRRRLFAEGME